MCALTLIQLIHIPHYELNLIKYTRGMRGVDLVD